MKFYRNGATQANSLLNDAMTFSTMEGLTSLFARINRKIPLPEKVKVCNMLVYNKKFLATNNMHEEEKLDWPFNMFIMCKQCRNNQSFIFELLLLSLPMG